MKLVSSFALLLAAVVFSAIPGIGALSDAEMKRLDLVEISSPKKKTSSMSSHLTSFRRESVVNIIHVLSENRGRRLRPGCGWGLCKEHQNYQKECQGILILLSSKT
eukprot:scaffold30233_cov94-Skeletonema_dohrnii-CCMP3373.AAC.1